MPDCHNITRDSFDPDWVLKVMRLGKFTHTEAHRLLEEACHAMVRLLKDRETTIKAVRAAIGDDAE